MLVKRELCIVSGVAKRVKRPSNNANRERLVRVISSPEMSLECLLSATYGAVVLCDA